MDVNVAYFSPTLLHCSQLKLSSTYDRNNDVRAQTTTGHHNVNDAAWMKHNRFILIQVTQVCHVRGELLNNAPADG